MFIAHGCCLLVVSLCLDINDIVHLLWILSVFRSMAHVRLLRIEQLLTWLFRWCEAFNNLDCTRLTILSPLETSLDGFDRAPHYIDAHVTPVVLLFFTGAEDFIILILLVILRYRGREYIVLRRHHFCVDARRGLWQFCRASSSWLLWKLLIIQKGGWYFCWFFKTWQRRVSWLLLLMTVYKELLWCTRLFFIKRSCLNRQ